MFCKNYNIDSLYLDKYTMGLKNISLLYYSKYVNATVCIIISGSESDNKNDIPIGVIVSCHGRCIYCLFTIIINVMQY